MLADVGDPWASYARQPRGPTHKLGLAARASVAAGGRRDRLLSLDVMRGATVAGMVLVNNPGSWTDGYGFLAHAAWNGCTAADLIFPFFLLMVGTSISLSLGRCRERASDLAAVLPRIIRRTILLFALGILLNGFAHPAELSTLRYFGVLQRIALCSLVASAIFLRTGVRGQVGWVVALLAAYWVAMKLVPVPGHGIGILEPHGNLAGYLDTLLFRGHLYHDDFVSRRPPQHDPGRRHDPSRGARGAMADVERRPVAEDRWPSRRGHRPGDRRRDLRSLASDQQAAVDELVRVADRRLGIHRPRHLLSRGRCEGLPTHDSSARDPRHERARGVRALEPRGAR